jgi:hypothetical protein
MCPGSKDDLAAALDEANRCRLPEGGSAEIRIPAF